MCAGSDGYPDDTPLLLIAACTTVAPGDTAGMSYRSPSRDVGNCAYLSLAHSHPPALMRRSIRQMFCHTQWQLQDKIRLTGKGRGGLLEDGMLVFKNTNANTWRRTRAPWKRGVDFTKVNPVRSIRCPYDLRNLTGTCLPEYTSR